MQVHYLLDGINTECDTIVERTVNPDDSVNVRISVTIDGKTYTVESSESTESAIVSLQNKLPQNIKILCCQSCIHGNFCAVGDKDNEIFCISDFEPESVDDIFYATEDDNEREKRSRSLLDYCDQHQKITDDRYSYNDWKYMIKG